LEEYATDMSQFPAHSYWYVLGSLHLLLWMTTFQQHNIPQKCWYIPGSLYYFTVQTIIIKSQNVIWISNMTLIMCLHSLTVHLYEQCKGYKRTPQQIPHLWMYQFRYCQCQALDRWELHSSGLLHSE